MPTSPVRIVDGFSSRLPGRDTIFFQRVYFAPVPVPFQMGAQPPFPVQVPLVKLETPTNQSIVIRRFAFRVYQHSGIAVDDIIEVPGRRTTTFIGFGFKIGNRSTLDFSTNVQAPNVPVVFNAGQGAQTVQGGSSQIFPFTGDSQPTGDDFAAYAMPGDLIEASAFFMRAPNFDARLISVQIVGWLVNSATLQKIINNLSNVRGG